MNAGAGTREGFWCECHTTRGRDASTLTASFDAYSPEQAVRWIRVALRTVTPALDPEPAAQAWHWLHHEQTQALAELHRGGTCTLVLRHRTTTLTWTVRPVSYLPLAHRYGTPLPSCAEHFTARAQQPD